MAYLKPQSPLKITNSEDHIYPLTTCDQVILGDGSRWDGDIGLYANPDETVQEMNGMPVVVDYAENAGMLNNIEASEYALKIDTALKTDTAPNADKLGGKDPKYYIQPRNLLDNSDFTNPVNQRNKTSYNAIGHTIDRWKLASEGTSVELIVGGGVKLINSTTDSRKAFAQTLEENYVGKTLTIAICDANTGNVYCTSETVPNTSTSVQRVCSVSMGGHTARLALTTGGLLTWEFMIATGGNATLRWAALYEGAYTSDNLPPYMPKGYRAELKECLRYYQVFNRNTLFHGPASSATALLCAAYTLENMRTTPTLIGTPEVVNIRGGGVTISDVTPTAASVSYYENGMLRLQLTMEGLPVRYMCEAILINFAVSADL